MEKRENILPKEEVLEPEITSTPKDVFFEEIRDRFIPYNEGGEKFDGDADEYHKFISQIHNDIDYFTKKYCKTPKEIEEFKSKMEYLRTYPHTTKSYSEIIV